MEYKKVIAHEVGHVLGVGRADDEELQGYLIDEVYSGDPDDPTPENITAGQAEIARWSIMRNGWSNQLIHSLLQKEYLVFSIEELITSEFEI